MAKKLSLDEKIKSTKQKLKALNQKKKDAKNKELVDFSNSIKKTFEKYSKFTLKNFETFCKQHTQELAKAMQIDTPTPTQNNQVKK